MNSSRDDQVLSYLFLETLLCSFKINFLDWLLKLTQNMYKEKHIASDLVLLRNIGWQARMASQLTLLNQWEA